MGSVWRDVRRGIYPKCDTGAPFPDRPVPGPSRRPQTAPDPAQTLKPALQSPGCCNPRV